MNMKFLGIIPARYSSTRFPGKPLADIGGMTMIERVYRQAVRALNSVWVATDDERIRDEVNRFGGQVVMTSPNHRSGTDRCYEAYTRIASGVEKDSQHDVIINIQGDEPFVDPLQIKQLMDCFDDRDTQIATLARRFDRSLGYKILSDPNLVKLVMGLDGRALYFSRSVIPYVRGVDEKNWPEVTDYYTHVGMYAYRSSTLEKIVGISPSPLEIAESLEQLRWLQEGLNIKVAITECQTIGIDTPADLENARKLLLEK